MGRNNKNIKYQMMKVLDDKTKIGTSKHIQQMLNKVLGKGYKSDYIHSIRTLELYKDEATRFSDYLKKSGFSFKKLSDIPRDTIADYIKSRNDKSSWTSHLTMAAMNKIFDTDFTTKELGLKQRRTQDITNNRGFGKTRLAEEKRFQNAINFIRGSGIRRSSVSNIGYNNFIFNKDGIIDCIKTKEKGGKLNHYYVLPDYQNFITDYVKNFYKINNYNTPLFSDFDPNRHINCHWYRNEYSCNLLNQLQRESDSLQPLFNGSDYIHTIDSSKVFKNFEKHGDTYKGYDTMILSLVSQCLGHYRLDVCVNHYLRF